MITSMIFLTQVHYRDYASNKQYTSWMNRLVDSPREVKPFYAICCRSSMTKKLYTKLSCIYGSLTDHNDDVNKLLEKD